MCGPRQYAAILGDELLPLQRWDRRSPGSWGRAALGGASSAQ